MKSRCLEVSHISMHFFFCNFTQSASIPFDISVELWFPFDAQETEIVRMSFSQ